MPTRREAFTHKGRRTRNEDSILSFSRQDGVAVCAVADGMGGHLAGDRASALAVEALRTTMEQFDTASDDPIDFLRQTFAHINSLIYRESRQSAATANMGTTLVSVVAAGGRTFVANVGDSRAYLLTASGIRQVSEDHTAIGRSLREGLITEDEAKASPYAHAILRAMGTEEHVEVDIFPDPLPAGEAGVFILCSDGLSNKVEMADIQQAITATPDLAVACRHLQSLAYQRGSDDNISIVALEVGSLPRRKEKFSPLPPIEKLALREPRRKPVARRQGRGMVAAFLFAVLILFGLIGYTSWYLFLRQPEATDSTDEISATAEADGEAESAPQEQTPGTEIPQSEDQQPGEEVEAAQSAVEEVTTPPATPTPDPSDRSQEPTAAEEYKVLVSGPDASGWITWRLDGPKQDPPRSYQFTVSLIIFESGSLIPRQRIVEWSVSQPSISLSEIGDRLRKAGVGSGFTSLIYPLIIRDGITHRPEQGIMVPLIGH